MVMDEISFVSVVMGFSEGGFSEGGFSEGGFSEGGFSEGGFSEGGFSEYRFSEGGFSEYRFSTGGFTEYRFSEVGFSTMDESTGKNSLISIVIGSDIIIYQRTFIRKNKGGPDSLNKKEGSKGVNLLNLRFPLKLKLNKQNKQKVLNKTINPIIKC
jgi:hypothetical protein